ncbi:class I glutamine amidotransferase-like protein [Setomelanomma holmii]|uniref:Class I glutamine amidotransferase-like protein n=1 Tax=Setomelanomma holmii TaxID=210430 RepID=A0A9P4LGF9_9PLEO|nr:class I glutamine amidotransferase-like protein [Setomelanomma holmii]
MVQDVHFESLVYKYQTMNVAGPFDFINLASRRVAEYGHSHGAVSQSTIDAAHNFHFHHISETLDAGELMSSGFKITPTDTLDDAPELDYLLIGGPMPETFEFPARYVEFIKHHHAAGKTILTTCTGAAALASTGLLDGKNATVNNVEYKCL